MAESPQVYRSGKIERLEHYRKRYADASAKERTRIAMEQSQVIHDVLIELLQDMQALREGMNELLRGKAEP